jgi:transcription termination/antitermination protein NusG
MPTLQPPQWYAIQTRSRFEGVVRDQLINFGIECLLPLCTRMSRWKDRTKRIEWPLFLRYCFARFALEQRRQVLQAPGVMQIVGTAHVAEPIPTDDIAAIQRIMQSGNSYRPYAYHVQEGRIVTVIRGPLDGLQGRLIRHTTGCHLVLAVTLIQQAVAVDISAEDVTLAEGQAGPTSPPRALQKGSFGNGEQGA